MLPITNIFLIMENWTRSVSLNKVCGNVPELHLTN